jgi:hypothetical protein
MFPGSEWHRTNFAYLLKQGLEARDEVVAAFTKLEQDHPMMKEVLRDTVAPARERFRARHAQYAELYKIVDPITEQLNRDGNASGPAQCIPQLSEARAKLAAQLGIQGESGIKQLVADDPLGHQISLALAYCYKRAGDATHARLEVENMRGGPDLANEAEELFAARKAAVAAAYRRLGIDEHPKGADRAKLEAEIPPLAFNYSGPRWPHSLVASSQLVHEIVNAPMAFVGDAHGSPLVIVSKTPTEHGVRLTFKKITYPFQKLRCYDSDRILRIEYSGSRAEVIYDKDCEPDGPPVQMTHQEPDLTVTAEDADHVSPGVQITAYVNRDRTQAAIVKAWPEGKPESPTLVYGIPLGH